MACGNQPKCQASSNSLAAYYDLFQKKSILQGTTQSVIKGATELDNNEHMGWFSKHITIKTVVSQTLEILGSKLLPAPCVKQQNKTREI